jgi:hypothetical protein
MRRVASSQASLLPVANEQRNHVTLPLGVTFRLLPVTVAKS